MEICEEIKNLITKPIEEAGYLLDEVLYVKEDGQMFLRIVIDKEGFIEIEDCLVVTKLIGPIIDEKDPISDNYIMDVCSKEKGCE